MDQFIFEKISNYKHSAARTRKLLFVIAFSVIPAFSFLWNNFEIGWFYREKESAKKEYNNYKSQHEGLLCDTLNVKSGIEPCRVVDTLESLKRRKERTLDNYNSNINISIPFIDTKFHVNDLGLLSNIFYLTLMLLLIYSIEREIRNLEKAVITINNSPESKDDYLDIIAGSTLFTVPEGGRKAFLLFPKLIVFAPSILNSIILGNDLSTYDKGLDISPAAFYIITAFELIALPIITILAVRSYRLLIKMDSVWAKALKHSK